MSGIYSGDTPLYRFEPASESLRKAAHYLGKNNIEYATEAIRRLKKQVHPVQGDEDYCI